MILEEVFSAIDKLDFGQAVILVLSVVLMLAAVAKWYVAEQNGSNSYKRNPQAKAFEEGMKSGAITKDNYGQLLSKVDLNASNKSQADQIAELCRDHQD